VTNHLIISNDKDSNSENRIKLRVRDIPFNLGVMDLRGPPLMQANGEKIDALKRCAQEIACDRRSCDDVQISYLETLEERDNDNLRLAQMLAG
jgi:hypothetical protein